MCCEDVADTAAHAYTLDQGVTDTHKISCEATQCTRELPKAAKECHANNTTNGSSSIATGKLTCSWVKQHPQFISSRHLKCHGCVTGAHGSQASMSVQRLCTTRLKLNWCYHHVIQRSC